jgi:Phage tail lysozyme
MADQLKIQRTPQLDEAMRILTDGTFRQMTGNRVPALNRSQAAALLGNIVHETGSPDLRNLDVVERDGGAGRGIAQYTGPRRQAYDAAMGINPNRNSVRGQLQYMAEEYAGKHDPAPGQSLVGYTKALENLPKDTHGATKALLNNYFRPADPKASEKQRIQNALAIQKLYQPPAQTAKAAAGVPTKKPNSTASVNPLTQALQIGLKFATHMPGL